LDVGIAGLSAGIVLSFQAGFIGPVEATVRAGVFGWSLAVVAGLLLALAAVYRRRVLLPELIGLGADVLNSIEAPLTDCARHFDTVMADLRRTQRQTARLQDLELDHQLRRFAQELRTGAWMECLYEKRWSDCHAVLDVCEEELARFNQRAGEQFHEPPPKDNTGDESYAPMTLELAYEILKARPGCSAGDLERIIKNLRRAYHPDLFTDPAEKRHYDRLLASVNQAYQFILDHGV
jgi:hypothetical protein